MFALMRALAPVWEGLLGGKPLILVLEGLTTQQWAVIIENVADQMEQDPRLLHLFRTNPLLADILADVHRQTLKHKG